MGGVNLVMSDSTSSSVEYRIDHERLLALKSATNGSKYLYESEYETIMGATNQLDADSPVVAAMVEHINELFGDNCYCEFLYQAAINSIDNYL